MLEANTILPAVAVSGQKDPPRLVQRNLAFHQSRNILQVAHNKGFNIGRLIRHDYFHVLLRLPLWKIVMLIIFSWTVVILFFAGVYYANGQMQSNPSCALGLNGTPVSFATAFAFSLETCSTVGYG
jgi:potassium inwardly-rectifying channel subfamily J protein 9